jgi:hypothetical protein
MLTKAFTTTICTLLALAGSLAPSGYATPPPGSYTYDEARTLGIATLPEPSELGMAACNPNPLWHGYATREEAALAALLAQNERPVCAADPRGVIYSVGLPTPYPELDGINRYIGAVTYDAFGSTKAAKYRLRSGTSALTIRPQGTNSLLFARWRRVRITGDG